MKSETINLVMGHVIIKGAGRDKTFLTMGAPMKPQLLKLCTVRR